MGVGFVAGRIDPLVIDLMAHQTHIFYVSAEQLALPPKYRQVNELLTEEASLLIRLDRQEAGGDPRSTSQLPFWKGTAETTGELKIGADASPPLEADPRDINDAIALSNRYWVVSDETTVRSPRAHLVSWVIRNQPDVCLNNPGFCLSIRTTRRILLQFDNSGSSRWKHTGRIPAFCKMLASL